MDREITLAHGAGGAAYRDLVRDVFLPAYGSDELRTLGDSALCRIDERAGVAFTTDAFVVQPLVFPGGDIGSLAVSGTVNDLAMAGSVPRWLSVAMILEAGLPVETLRSVSESIAETAKRAGVSVVTGDTKVVERAGREPGLYVCTSGVGTLDGGWKLPPQTVSPGDKLIVSGQIARHGMAVMAAREGLDFSPAIESDAKPLASLARAALETGLLIHAMRDPTRGGVGATLCEWTREGADVIVEEERLPVAKDARAACALLGMDPLFAANEGVFLLAAPEECARPLLEALRAHPDGRDAAIIGHIEAGAGQTLAQTEFGTRRRVWLPRGEILPRIC